MKEVLILVLVLLTTSVLVGCSEKSNAKINVNYEIATDTSKSNIKRTVEVLLESRTDEESLKIIAKKIKSEKSVNYQRTFIGYRIKGDSSSTFWATTNFNPDLEVQILGLNKTAYESLKAVPTSVPDKDLIGAWMANWGSEYKIIVYRKDDKVYMQSIYSGEHKSDKIFELTDIDGNQKLEDENGKERGEYYLINKSGNLEFWSVNGNYYTAPNI